MTTQYVDYELELDVSNGQDQWPLTVIQSPAGQGRGVLTLPAAPKQIALQAQTARPDEARVLGKILFDRLMANTGIAGPYMESLGTAEARGQALRVKLRIVDSQLALVPWELIYEDRFDEYMALSHETPIIRYAEAAQPQTPLAVKPPLRILGLAVSPNNLEPIDVDAQRRVVETGLAALIDKGVVELTWLNGGTWRSLQQALRGSGPWHVFHFVGHGMVDVRSGEGVLAFADESGNAHPLGASELGRILASHRPLRLALLNACHSATPGADNLYTSAAATLVRRGLPAVIAMQFAILDKTGVELARTFYEALADGLPVEAALTDARIAVSIGYRDLLDWAAPVLYLRAPDGVLFAIDRKTWSQSSDAETAMSLGMPASTVYPQGKKDILSRAIEARDAINMGVPAEIVYPELFRQAQRPEHSSDESNAPVPPARLIVPNVRALKGTQLQAAMKAIGSAYSTKAVLRQMVSIQLEENLETIVGDGSLDNMIFDLLEWARMRGKLTELLQGAVDGNPTNPTLRAFVQSLQE